MTSFQTEFHIAISLVEVAITSIVNCVSISDRTVVSNSSNSDLNFQENFESYYYLNSIEFVPHDSISKYRV